VLVGDGRSDNCLASRADVVFAKSTLAAYCQKSRIPFHPFNSFADVLAAVRKWPAPAAVQSQIA
jgi:2-hydroxy-3-keto-5-methylthiopentenyl-1-phosphate phosphatase